MDKLKHCLYFTFVLIPLFYFCGLSIIMIDNKEIVNCQFYCKKLKKTKREIDKYKFEKMMKRLTKQEEVIKLVQVKYELLPAQKQFLELGEHNSDIDVSLYQ